jgi:hypothetical protein
MTQPLSGQVVKPDDVLIRDLGSESVLLNLASESYFGLDEIGTRMWAALANTPSIEAAFGVLLAEYDVEAEPLRADLTAFLQKLSEAGLIVIVDGPPRQAA